LVNNNPKSPTFGQNITSVANPYGPLNSPLANSPPFQANLRARYEMPVRDYKVFFQAGGQHIGNSYSATGNVQAYDQPGFTTYDAAVGASKDAWNVQFFGQNLTDVNASTFTNSYQFIKTETVIRPRIMGIKIGYKF
jgi:hypothetical protein